MTKPTKSSLSGEKAVNQPASTDFQIESLGRTTSASDQLLSVYSMMRDALLEVQLEASKAPTKTMSVDDLQPGDDLRLRSPVKGVSIGMSSLQSGGAPGEPALRLYVGEDMSREQAIHHAANVFGVTAMTDDSLTVDVINTGVIDALSHRARWRPIIPCGTSTGHRNISAGTLGCYARGKASDREDRQLFLSNNHVLANVNQASIGDEILQPGGYDGGLVPSDVIAILENYVTIDFSGPNTVDAATAWVDDSFRDPHFLYMNSGAPNFFRVSSIPAPATPSLLVGKSGRTTGLTSGSVTAVGAVINVNMGQGRIANFVDQIEIRGTNGTFSAGGDSGSLIWTWDDVRNPIGLLFAGGGGSTFANPIDLVLSALDIELDT